MLPTQTASVHKYNTFNMKAAVLPYVSTNGITTYFLNFINDVEYVFVIFSVHLRLHLMVM